MVNSSYLIMVGWCCSTLHLSSAWLWGLSLVPQGSSLTRLRSSHPCQVACLVSLYAARATFVFCWSCCCSSRNILRTMYDMRNSLRMLMMWLWMMLCPVIGVIYFSRLPLNSKLLLAFAISEPVKPHAHCRCVFGLYFTIDDSVCHSIVSL